MNHVPEEDVDGDGTPAMEDCDDQNPNLNGHDSDGDGFSNCAGDCNINDGSIFPLQEIPMVMVLILTVMVPIFANLVCSTESIFQHVRQPSTWQILWKPVLNEVMMDSQTIINEDENNLCMNYYLFHAEDMEHVLDWFE